MSSFKLVTAAILLSTTASADVQIFNATRAKMKVEVTLPNGKVQPAMLDEAIDSIDGEKWTLAAGVKRVKISISDDAGVAVWSGTVGENDAGVIVPSGKGAKYVPSGTYSGSGNAHVAVFMNITGDPITLDLEGRNGLGAHRGLATGPAFDVAKAITLDPREATFGVTLKVKGADAPIELESTAVTPGHYYVLWKRARDEAYRLLAAGYLPPPKPVKKKN